jgi:hypothetical protein
MMNPKNAFYERLKWEETYELREDHYEISGNNY